MGSFEPIALLGTREVHPVAFSLQARVGEPRFAIASTPVVDECLAAGAVVAVGISGGKDSAALAIRLAQHLDAIGHSGPRVLIHSDLGNVEWKDSLPACQRLAARLGWELVVVRRQAGGLMERWETRWRNNVARYANLECVKLILPWSTPGMRFCTSELKTAVICQALKKRYPGCRILSATGVRHAESAARAKMPIASEQPRLASRSGGAGLNWNPIITWDTPDVFAFLDQQGEPLHEAYTRYGSSRVSCTFCIMGSGGDLAAAAKCADNADIYRRMVDLEIASTFGLQGSRWLGDIAPALLGQDRQARLALAKTRAERRKVAEARLPSDLQFEAGWPRRMPTSAEAGLIASVRREVAEAVGIHAAFTDAEGVMSRYLALLQAKDTKVMTGRAR